ncbi:HD domain-containing protein [Azotosporobacter soli]|uniref:HD domain-containing protein n=1 Tax=Azotosporobacter soli TaxID=3055040 RepID=UPI0031FE894C
MQEKLREAEQRLFWGMSLPDQRHVLNVAYTAIRLAAGKENLDVQLLVRCALLHDVGRQNGDVSTWDKIIAVLLHAAMPKAAMSWAKEGRGGKIDNVRHAVYIYFNHPKRSAIFLREIGTESDVIEIVSRHHKAPVKDEPPELALLRQADSLN